MKTHALIEEYEQQNLTNNKAPFCKRNKDEI